MTSMTILPKFVALVILVTSVLAGEPDCARSYTVKHGDNCDSISAAHNASTFQLAQANPNINAACSNLVSGESLCLGRVGYDCNTTTVVHNGDTCHAISVKAGIPLALLLKNNPNINSRCGNIYPGEVLCTINHEFTESLEFC